MPGGGLLDLVGEGSWCYRFGAGCDLAQHMGGFTISLGRAKPFRLVGFNLSRNQHTRPDGRATLQLERLGSAASYNP